MQRHAPPTVRSLPLALVVLVAVFALVQIRARPTGPLPANAPAQQFSAARAGRILRMLVGDGQPHQIGSDANTRVRDRIVAHLTALGYEPEVQVAFTCGANGVCATVRNVLARVPGRPGARAVLLASHYDSVAAGPGASDAGASVAAMLEIARILRSDPPRRSAVLLLMGDGEEAGLLGAQAFAEAHPWAAEVGAVVNLEARGTSGASLMFEVSGESGWLVRRLAASLARPAASSLFYPVYERLPNDTDLTVFRRFGKAGVNFAFIGQVAKYHTPLDSADNASLASVQHQGENALAMTRALADIDLADRSVRGDVVFFDVLGLGIARWALPLTLPLAIADLVLVLLCALLGARHGSPLWRSLVGLVAWLVAIVASGLVAWGLSLLVDRLRIFPAGATTRPALAAGAFWLIGLAVPALVAALFGRWTLGAGAWTGCWTGWSLAAIAAARFVPEAAYVFVVPAGVAGLAGLAVGLARREPFGWFPRILPLVAAGVLWMSPAWFLPDALGASFLPLVAGVVGVFATALSPFVAEAGPRWRWGLPAGLLALASIAGLFAVKAPAFSPDRPERMNIVFFQEAPNGDARWLVSPQSGRLPAPLRKVADFGSSATAAFPWARTETAYVARASSVDVPGPELEIQGRGLSEGHRTVRARLVSPRGAPIAMVLLPIDRTVAVGIAGRRVPRQDASGERRARPRASGASRFRSYAIYTLPADGAEVEIVIAGDEPLNAFVLDETPGLPPAGDVLLKARPREAARSDAGDVTILMRRVML